MPLVKPPTASSQASNALQGNSLPAELLTLLLEQGPQSRAELAAALELSRPTLTELSRKLLNLNLIREQAPSAETAKRKGRPGINLELNPAFGTFAGVHIRNGAFSLALTDLSGKVVARSEGAASQDIDLLSQEITTALEQLRETHALPRKQLSGLGLALSGYIDQASGICWQSANLGWFDLPVARVFSEATGLVTTIENDAKAAALGEKRFGLARDTANFTLVTLGESIGAAHVIRGELYRGQTGAAGELAHCTVVTGPSARLCRCGKRGCLDTVASSTALLEQAQERGLNVQTVSELEKEAVQGNVAARTLLQEAAQALGLVLSFVAQSHDPEMLVIADQMGFSQGYFLTVVRQTIENNILPRLLSTLRIELHPVTSDFWARGAASVAIQHFFSSLKL